MKRPAALRISVFLLVIAVNGPGPWLTRTVSAETGPAAGETNMTTEQRLDNLEKEVQLLRKLLEEERQKNASQAAPPAAATSTADASAGNLAEQYQELDQRQRILERKYEVDQEAALAKAKDAPIITASSKDGFSIKSQDNAFVLKLRGYAQADGRFLIDGDEKTSKFLLRRVRPIFEGTVFKDFDFRIMPDFGGGSTVLQDTYVEWKHFPFAKVRAGKFKAPFGLERLQSGTEIPFVERALPTNLVPNRDIGAQISGDVLNGVLNYAVGLFNGVPDGGSGDTDFNDDKDFVGRIFAQPFKNSDITALAGLGIGVAASYGNQEGALPSYKTQTQENFFTYKSGAAADGDRYRISPQGYYFLGPFGLLGEYVFTSQDVELGNVNESIENDSWQVTTSYVVTGEDATYKGVSPLKPFDVTKGQWGALELKARYAELDVDDDAFDSGLADPAKAAESAKAWGVGLNWYLNKSIKYVLDFEQTHFDGGQGTGDRDTENAILTRVQVSF